MPSEKNASPERMLKIMLYAYNEDKDISSRAIETRCKRDINYKYLSEGKPAQDYAVITKFKTKHFTKCLQNFLS